MAGHIPEFLRHKWCQWFHMLDLKKDGVLTADDYSALADHISKATGASEEEAAKTREEWVGWLKYLQPDPSIVVDEERYLTTCAEVYQDVENHRRMVRSTASDMFDRLDFNHDGRISLDELEIFYQAIGVRDKDLIKERFTRLDKDGDGFLNREEVVDDIVRHFTDPDPTTGQTYLLSVGY